MAEHEQDQPEAGSPQDQDGDQLMANDHDREEDNNDDDQEIKQSEEAAERAQQFQALCDAVHLAPKFEEHELVKLTVAQLKIIANHWGITVRSSTRKNTLISTIFAHENNEDPGWVFNLHRNDILLPSFK